MTQSTYRFLWALVFTGALLSCDDYLDINTNPNEPTFVPLNSLMATVSFSTGENIQAIGGVTSYYVQYLASPNASGSSDTQEPVAYDNAWFLIYHTLADLSDMEIQAEESGAAHYLGVAKILKAVHLQLIVDAWGDAPYSEGLFAQDATPAYDTDEVLYQEIMTLLDDGIAELSKDESSFVIGNDDFIFGYLTDEDNTLPHRQAWIKTANALKARTLLHASKTGGYDPQEVLAAVELGFQSNDDNATVEYFETEFNPWASVARNQENLILDGWISEQLADAMNGTTFGIVDPRMPFMFGANDEGDFIGVPNGAGRGGADVSGDRSVLERGTYYASDVSPLLIITYAEQKFIEAEAAFDAGDQPRAYEAYLDGIAAHMDMVGVAAPDRDAYLANAEVSVGSANIDLDLIMKEKYVAMFLHPEAWTDARRYNFQYTDMTLAANLNPDLSGNYARRLVYPDSETGRNGSNVPSVTQLDRIWWDVAD